MWSQRSRRRPARPVPGSGGSVRGQGWWYSPAGRSQIPRRRYREASPLRIVGCGERPVGLAVDLLLDAAEGGLDVTEGLGAVHRLAVEPFLQVLGDALLVRREQAVDGLQYGE